MENIEKCITWEHSMDEKNSGEFDRKIEELIQQGFQITGSVLEGDLTTRIVRHTVWLESNPPDRIMC